MASCHHLAMGSTVALFNPKGGVGKTTVALGLASAAWAADEQVLVVDLDPLGAATWHLGRDPEATTVSLAELLARPTPGAAGDAIVPSAWSSRVHVLPGSSRLGALDGVGPTRAELQRLATVLDGLAEHYHAILLPLAPVRAGLPEPSPAIPLAAPPPLGALTMSARTAADGALVVGDPSEFGLRGIAPAVELVTTMGDQTNPSLHMGGIVLNK